jgi:hypothetical protein
MLNHRSHNSADVDLRSIAKQAMIDRGFLIQVPEEAQTELKMEREPAFETLNGHHDLSDRRCCLLHATGVDSRFGAFRRGCRNPNGFG